MAEASPLYTEMQNSSAADCMLRQMYSEYVESGKTSAQRAFTRRLDAFVCANKMHLADGDKQSTVHEYIDDSALRV